MLPSKLQNFDEPLSEEGLKEYILRRIRQILQESSLLRQNSGNVTVDHGVINRQSHLIFQLRARERILQAEQRKTVSSLMLNYINQHFSTSIFHLFYFLFTDRPRVVFQKLNDYFRLQHTCSKTLWL